MSRFRVTTTSQAVYLVDAGSEREAASKGVALAQSRVRPSYALETTADAELYSETITAQDFEDIRETGYDGDAI